MNRTLRHKMAGLTLVELMITLAVLAFLSAVAIPMYQAQVLKSRRIDARSALMELALLQEREFSVWGGYSEPDAAVANVTADDNLPAPDANSTFMDDLARIADEYGDFYNFDVTATDTTFTITATQKPNQTGDTACATLSIDQTGTKGATNVNLCW